MGYKPLTPYVNIARFNATFGKAYINKAKGAKIIMKGLNLLDAFVDVNGEYLPGKSTLVINSDNIAVLHLICAVLNSSFSIFYLKTKYSSSSYCGGITFTKEMIDSLPLPQLTATDEQTLIDLSKRAASIRLNNPTADISDILKQIDVIIFKRLRLSYKDILIVDSETSITEEEYNIYE